MPTFKRSWNIDVRGLDAVAVFERVWRIAVDASAKLPGNANAQEKVWAESTDGAEFEGTSVREALEHLNRDARSPAIVSGSIRRTFVGDHTFWFYWIVGHAEISVKVVEQDEGWVIGTYDRLERERLLIEETPTAAPGIQPAILTTVRPDSQPEQVELRRRHGWSALSVTAKWFWGIGAPVVVVVLATVITNALGLTGS